MVAIYTEVPAHNTVFLEDINKASESAEENYKFHVLFTASLDFGVWVDLYALQPGAEPPRIRDRISKAPNPPTLGVFNATHERHGSSCISFTSSVHQLPTTMDVSGNVYLGLWTNWSRGLVLGSTWTLSREHGNYIIVLTAFCIAFVATRFWRIACFFLHRYFTNSASAQTIQRQRQVILCNSSSPEAGFVSLFSLLWSWRHLGLRSLYGLSLLIVLVILCFSGFVDAGSYYSSAISTDAGNEVLLRSDRCGFIRDNPKTARGLFNFYSSQMVSKAIDYAEERYLSNRISSMIE
ncbi:uncharacterized protein PG998_003881 [Apiospora kogelbergensis]|uniref:uncharacterized protein n=1 Tax=Apiospora kogelbergensis TaxID=1337665 RepID=UPI00312D4BEE